MMTMEKDLSLAKKKLDYLKMKMCKGIHLRWVKIKGFAHKVIGQKELTPCDKLIY